MAVLRQILSCVFTEPRGQDLGETLSTTSWGGRASYLRKDLGDARIAVTWQGEHGRGFRMEAGEA